MAFVRSIRSLSVDHSSRLTRSRTQWSKAGGCARRAKRHPLSASGRRDMGAAGAALGQTPPSRRSGIDRRQHGDHGRRRSNSTSGCDSAGALLSLAAAALRRPASDLDTRDGQVVARGGGNSVSFAALIGGAAFELPVDKTAPPRDPDAYTIVGTSYRVPDLPAKLTARPPAERDNERHGKDISNAAVHGSAIDAGLMIKGSDMRIYVAGSTSPCPVPASGVTTEPQEWSFLLLR